MVGKILVHVSLIVIGPVVYVFIMLHHEDDHGYHAGIEQRHNEIYKPYPYGKPYYKRKYYGHHRRTCESKVCGHKEKYNE